MLKKILFTILAIFLGILLFGIAKELLGFGQYIAAGLLVYTLFLIWKKQRWDDDERE